MKCLLPYLVGLPGSCVSFFQEWGEEKDAFLLLLLCCIKYGSKYAC